ncbi:MAG: glycosyltransferase [Pseudomonadota bacterium]
MNVEVGVVIIGRNEGDRLIQCLKSLSKFTPQIVYVDSSSSDNSLEEAKNHGAHAVSLDMSQGFTAARARNAGFKKIIEIYPDLTFIQFVDGDCEVLEGWIENSVLFLKNNSHVAVVNGVLDERFPNKTIYNRMCDSEWKTPTGELKYCGGNALMRVDAFKNEGGFLPDLIAGEEPELCIRLRRSGWKIWHLNHPMMLHDANITSFFQWWKRTMRAGYAFAEGANLHGVAPEYHWIKESRRAWFWGFILPIITLVMFFLNWKIALILLLVYPLQIVKLTFKRNNPINFYFAFFLVLGKFAEAIGQLKFLKKRYLKEKAQLIEYK